MNSSFGHSHTWVKLQLNKQKIDPLHLLAFAQTLGSFQV